MVTALLLSTLRLTGPQAEKIKLVVEGEGFDCSMSVNLHLLLEALRVDDRDKQILLALEGERLTLSEIARKTGLPKSTLHRRLEELVDKGLVVKTESETYALKRHIEIICLE